MTKEEAVRGAVAYWLEKATAALASARAELAADRRDFAVNRAYYAAFYAASAVLLARGQHFVKHTGVRAAVHRSLIKRETLDAHWGQVFDRLFDGRQRADYLALVTVDPDEARSLIRDAEGFVEQMRRLVPESSPGQAGPGKKNPPGGGDESPSRTA